MWGSPIATPPPPTSPPGPTTAPRPHSDAPGPIAPPTCCQGSFCNRLPGDPPAPSSAPRLPPGCRQLLLLPLVALRLWG
ncbi:forkhead box protein L2-like [Dryobates pubescens]|uniref:forkhead box protein L2-like n=1 Tax=Dryobates pubescens TaxID=118200 RepID=UPI0023B9EE6D|nr:forkhead box protein L2-like [Dryobates pubescens]